MTAVPNSPTSLAKLYDRLGGDIGKCSQKSDDEVSDLISDLVKKNTAPPVMSPTPAEMVLLDLIRALPEMKWQDRPLSGSEAVDALCRVWPTLIHAFSDPAVLDTHIGAHVANAMRANWAEEQPEELPDSVLPWMRLHQAEHVDQDTGETNMTTLAEAAAAALNLYGPDGSTIPENVFDAACDVADDD